MKNSHTFSRICGYAMFLLILAQIVLVLASWLITAAMPDVFPRSLLSPEGIRWFFGTFTANLQSPWLVWLLLISIAWGTLRASGLLNYDPKVYRQRNALRLVCLEFVLFISVMPCSHRFTFSPGSLPVAGLPPTEEGRQESCIQKGKDARDCR